MFGRVKRDPITHDYTRRRWGHDYYVRAIANGGTKIELGGWGSGISKGDYLMLQNGDGVTRYRVDTIKYIRDPRDMWFAEATFSPR